MQKETGRNEQTKTDILDPLQPLLKGTETKYEMKTKGVSIIKERKQKWKDENGDRRGLRLWGAAHWISWTSHPPNIGNV